jgi:hypothetical protein
MRVQLSLCAALIGSINVAMAQLVCGQAPVVADETTRIQLARSANAIAQNASSPNFTALLQQDKQDIFHNYPKGDRAVAYYQYIVCQFLSVDSNLTGEEKISQLNKAFSALFQRTDGTYSVYYFLVLNADGITRSELRKDGDVWREIQHNIEAFEFSEAERNADYVWIVDRSRGVEIKIPEKGGVSLERLTGGTWRDWNVMHPISP